MKLTPTHKYDDIIHLPHPVSQGRSRMTNADRAAQFSPFAALTGFDGVIAETARLTESGMELDDMEKERLNHTLREIQQRIHTQPEVSLTWFRCDQRKAGGAYLCVTGHVKKLDVYSNTILLTDGRAIPIQEITELILL